MRYQTTAIVRPEFIKDRAAAIKAAIGCTSKEALEMAKTIIHKHASKREAMRFAAGTRRFSSNVESVTVSAI